MPLEMLNTYLTHFSQDEDKLTLLKQQLSEEKNIFDRKNFTGHIVANSLVIDMYNNAVLTIFHNALQMYIQPGGHVEGDDDSIVHAAQREAREETGLKDLTLFDWHTNKQIPLFIESHYIPPNPNKGEDEHYHHDFMYAFATHTQDVNLQVEEVSDFSWVNIATVLEENPNSFLGKVLRRMSDIGVITT